MKLFKYILLLTIALQIVGCLEEETPQSQIDEENLVNYLNSNKIDATRDQNGYYYAIINSGIGETLVDTSVIRLDIKLSNLSKTQTADTLLIKAIRNLNYAITLGLTKIKVGGEIDIYIPAYMNDGVNALATKCKPTQIFASQRAADDTIINEYLATHNLTATKDPNSGIYYNITTPGSDKHPTINSTVTVKYIGKLTNDYLFDGTSGSATSTFALNGLILGWQYALPKLGEGGKGQFYIPSALGYGDRILSTIPANSVLIFDITLVTTK